MRTTTPHLKHAAQLVLLGIAVLALMGAGDEEARFNNLGHKLMCICGCNQVLLECNHVGCPRSDQMRNELAASVSRGDSDDLNLQSFVQKYGPTVLLAPTTTGFNRVAWIVPYLVLCLGLTMMVLIVRGWRGGGPGGSSGSDGGGGASSGNSGGPELDRFREQARKDTEE
jgi:cytochrome c-type biogenesis protein CcmH/NrfF